MMRAGLEVDVPASDHSEPFCGVVEWARCGAMSLTGHPSAPLAPGCQAVVLLAGLIEAIDLATRAWGRRVRLRLGEVLAGRAAVNCWRRRGRTSANGTCRLLETADGWAAINLARRDDIELLPAVIGGPPNSNYWARLEAAARGASARDLVERAQLVGIPAAALGDAGPDPSPLHIRAAGAPDAPIAQPVVIDLSAMWAGPLCAHVLGRTGARVIKVESSRRPDGARFGRAEFYDWLHTGHESVCLDLGSADGVHALRAIVGRADVVIESSRPRAMEAFGIDPEQFVAARPGRTWISITGYGRRSAWSNRVAFGDDAAVAGGLVAHDDDMAPVFCADAIADPATGLIAALAAVASLISGGGRLVEVAMAGTAAYLAAPGDGPASEHPITRDAHGWVVAHDDQTARVAPPPCLPASPPARQLGADNALFDEVLARADRRR